ncbi:MAG: type II secretion system F family protein [Solobacterium sp.]|jgi:type IV pilus assembly protein PilC|nr:type II secretion system F family protein [Solobacterium sp.]MCH4266191.1 type II secretion system F family protein [Solobacterium sp.]
MTKAMLNNHELSAFCGQMAVILKAGISSVEGITMMNEETDSEADKKLLTAILHSYDSTGHLYSALAETRAFPDYLVQMTRIGEESGSLDDVMSSLSDHYDREETVRRSIRNAVVYPLIMTGMMVAVIIILLVNVMPVFSQVFEELGTSMSGLALTLYNIGNVLRQYALTIVLILAAILCLFLAVELSSGKGSLRYKIGRHFKSIRRSNEEIAACRFASGMALTLHSGLNPDQCLELSEALNEDPDFAEKLSACRKEVEDGRDLSDSLKSHQIFTGIYARMASIGSKAGSLDSVMGQIADLYENDIDTSLNNRLAVIEPTLIIVLSVLVGAILLSVMFPLLSIMSSL